MIAIKKDAMRYRDPETGKFVGVSLIGGDAPSDNPVSGALTANEKALMLALFKSAEYTSNVKAVVAQIEAIWTGGSTITYSVTNNLTNVSTDNDASTTAGGMAYTATLTADEGYTLSEVIVTMDDEDVTADVYADGVVNIASVLGDIVITAKAAKKTSLEPVYELSNYTFDGKTSEIDTGYSFYREDADDIDFTFCIDYTGITGICSLVGVGYNEEDQSMAKMPICVNTASYWQWIRLCGVAVDTKWTNGNYDGYKIVLSHRAGSSDGMAYYMKSADDKMTTATVTGITKTTNAINANVILGGFFRNDTKYLSSDVTINSMKIYDRVLSEDEVKAFMGVA